MLFCYSIILGLVYVEQQSYIYTTSNKAIMLAIQKNNLKLINISTQIWDWLSDVTTSIGGKSITSINTNCAYYPYNSQTITIDNKIYSLENPYLQTESCSSGNIDFVIGSDEVVYLTGNHQLLAFGLFTQRGGQRYPIKNSIKNYKKSILKVKTNHHERLNPLVDDKIVEVCEVNWTNTSTTSTNYCLNVDAFQNRAGTTLAWDGLFVKGKYAFNDGSSAVIISQELSTDPITLYPCYTYRDELQPTLIPTTSPTFSIKRVLSMNSLLNISGITSTSFDLPAQTAFIKTISLILGIDQTNVIITKIIDYFIPSRRLDSKLINNENNKIESRILLEDTKTEISFKINAVTETLGYSDPNEMSSSFQSKLSTSIQNSTFVNTFISECVNEGSNQITSSTSIECSLPIYDNITVLVVSTNLPTLQPTQSPTLKKTSSPTSSGTSSPTNSGTQNPTNSGTQSPTNGEIISPRTNSPTNSGTQNPTNSGTQNPTNGEIISPPTNSPTNSSPQNPINSGTQNPTKSPSLSPTMNPTNGETNSPPTNSGPNSPTNSGTNPPTNSPSLNPSLSPTNVETILPTNSGPQNPINSGTQNPTNLPSLNPTNSPTNNGINSPLTNGETQNPTNSGTNPPTKSPTNLPSLNPTMNPTNEETNSPTNNEINSPPTNSGPSSPTNSGTQNPTNPPTSSPSLSPTMNPTKSPTNLPTNNEINSPPTNGETQNPTNSGTNLPTKSPTNLPSLSPSLSPTNGETNSPTNNGINSPPTNSGSSSPTNSGTQNPTNPPTSSPSLSPTKSPTNLPTNNEINSPPTSSDTQNPTKSPTSSPSLSPSLNPTNGETNSPTNNGINSPPTNSGSSSPTNSGTQNPTNLPSLSPTMNPTKSPTNLPSLNPSFNPTNLPTSSPSLNPSLSPTNGETNSPTNNGINSPPTNGETQNPTNSGTNLPTKSPTSSPSLNPTNGETNPPTNLPSLNPTMNPTNLPTKSPTSSPSLSPSLNPTLKMTNSPTQKPSLSPTNTPLMSPPSPGALSLPQLRSRLVDAKKVVNNRNIKRRYLRHSDYIKKQNIKSNLTLNSSTFISNDNNNDNNNSERYTLLPGNTSSSNSLDSMKLSNCKSIWLSSGYDVRVSCYELLITQPTPSLGYLSRASYNYDSVLSLYNTLFGCDQLIEQSTDQIQRFYIHSPTALESTLDDGYSHGVFISTDNQQAWTLQSTSDILQLKAHNFIDDSTLGIDVYFITRSLGTEQLFYTMNRVTLSTQVDGTIQSKISTIFVPIIMYYYGYQGYPWIFHTAFILEVILAIILGLFTIRETFQLITHRIIPLIKWIYNSKSTKNDDNNNNDNQNDNNDNNNNNNSNDNNQTGKQNKSIKRQESISERISGRLRHVDSMINGNEELEKNQLYIMLNEKYESDGKVYHDILDWITIIIILIRFLYRFRYIEKAHNLHTFLISLEAENSFNTRLKTIVQQFQDIESLDNTFRLLSIMIIFVGTFQFFRYISFDPRCRIIITTLHASLSGLIPVLIIFLAILTAYAVLASGLYGIQIPQYNTFQNSVAALFVMLLGDWNYYDLLEVSTIETQIFFWSFMILISFILFNMVIAIIFTTYEAIFEITQLERKKNQDKEN